MLDPRLLRVGIEVNNQFNVYEGLAITATGFKSGSLIQNACTLTIANLDEETRNFLLTEGNPYNRIRTSARSRVVIECGRESYGYFVLYRGDIITVGVSQPPDITVVINCLTGNFFKGSIVSRSAKPLTPVSEVAAQVAMDLGVSLRFEATDKLVSNWNFTGSAEKQINKLYNMGNYDAYLDDDTLIVADRNRALTGDVRELSQENGLIGVPEIIDNGVRIRMLVDNHVNVGTRIDLVSDFYPAVNGSYKIVKLGFEVANRDTPFYYIADAIRTG